VIKILDLPLNLEYKQQGTIMAKGGQELINLPLRLFFEEESSLKFNF